MILTCPECAAQYVLPDDAIGRRGRRVKCTTCQHVWTERPIINQADEDDFEISPMDPFQARRDRFGAPVAQAEPIEVVTKAPKKDILLKTLGMAALLLVLIFGAAIAIRFSAVSWWPPLALFYETIGLPAEAPGKNLQLKNVKAVFDKTLDISGTLNNPSKQDQFLPRLQIRLNGEGGVLKHWNIDLYGKTLPAGKEAAFKYSLKNVPTGGQNVTLLFVD